MSYKRLTERVGNGVAIKETSTNDNKSIWNAIERLAELEDKIENGTLIELPCKVGTIVYYIVGIKSRMWLKGQIVAYVTEKPFLIEMINDYQKTWFLTKAEAEKKLKELQGEKE